MTRVLVIGRSPGVLLEIVDRLRDHGYEADATNQFDRVVDDYAVGEYDVLVFGGAVPPDTKQLIRARAEELNPHVAVVQGLAGIAGVVAGQVRELMSTHRATVTYEATPRRTVRLDLPEAAQVGVEAFWGTFVPPEPTSTSLAVASAEFESGVHEIPVPREVPGATSFVVVTVGDETSVLAVGKVQGLAPGTPLSVPTPVSTGL